MKKNKMKNMPLIMFICSLIFAFFIYGLLVGKNKIFPYKLIKEAIYGYKHFEKLDELPQYFKITSRHYTKYIKNSNKAFQGINLISKINANREMIVEIMDMGGNNIHSWDIDWFDVWPDAKHIRKEHIPKSKPGSLIHGISIMQNGNLVFNFDTRGLVCLDKNSNVVWKIPYQTHHSVHLDENENIWVSGLLFHKTKKFNNRKSPYCEYTILKVSKKGKILKEWSISKLLEQNNLEELLHFGYMPSGITFFDDRLHLNDIEPFPDSLGEGYFKKGDVVVSLRNINTILVFNEKTNKIKYTAIGKFVRHHDPDFISGNEISVFDNNYRIPQSPDLQSKIVILDAKTDSLRIYFEGNSEIPFYTRDMGKHQWLPNGNLLITEAREGRAFEIDKEGNLVWQYVNYVDKDKNIVGLVTEVTRYPLGYADFE